MRPRRRTRLPRAAKGVLRKSPILLLARLAVDRAYQGQGRSRTLLRFAFRRAVRLAAQVGCIGVVVDAKPGAVALYQRYGFEAFELADGGTPGLTQMFLPIGDIKAALKPPRGR